jgi:hypothetical protein
MVTICSIDIGVEHLSIIVIDPITKEIVYWAIHKVLELNGSFSHNISSLMAQALPFMTETVIIVSFNPLLSLHASNGGWRITSSSPWV